MSRFRSVMRAATLGALFSLASAPSWAAGSADWVSPASTILESFTDGLLQIAGPLVGLAITGYGIWGAITTEIQGRKLFMILASGILIFAGSSIASVFTSGG